MQIFIFLFVTPVVPRRSAFCHKLIVMGIRVYYKGLQTDTSDAQQCTHQYSRVCLHGAQTLWTMSCSGASACESSGVETEPLMVISTGFGYAGALFSQSDATDKHLR